MLEEEKKEVDQAVLLVVDDLKAAKESHRWSLIRIATAMGNKPERLKSMDTWEIEDFILSLIEQQRLQLKRVVKAMKKLTRESDMLRQTSIFDFLQLHHDDIKSQKTDNLLDDNG